MKQRSAGVKVASGGKVPTSEKLQSPDAGPGFLERGDVLLDDAAAVMRFCHKKGSRSTVHTAGHP